MNYPRTDLHDICTISDTVFWPKFRQEMSRVAGGRAQSKDLGPAIWAASFATAPDYHSEAGAIEAFLLSLNGSVHSFTAYDARRPYPKAYPTGNFSDTATIGSLNAADAFEIQLADLASGMVLSVGDYLGFEFGSQPSLALHLITEGGTADGSGDVTLRVFPHIDELASIGTWVQLKKPRAEFIIEPGKSTQPKIDSLTASSISFSAVQIF